MQDTINSLKLSDASDALQDLYRQMAELTYNECKDKCEILGSCCSLLYCNLAVRGARKNQPIELKEDDKLLLNEHNHCIVEPHLRPLCTLHICEKFLWNKEFATRYFKLRDDIERLEERSFYEII